MEALSRGRVAPSATDICPFLGALSSAAQGENDDDGICSRLPPPDETGTARAPLHSTKKKAN